MIKQFNDYDKTQGYATFETLPRGGYVLKIMGAQVCDGNSGQYIKIGCDVAEGEYAGFFEKAYRNDQRETKKWGCNYLLNIPKDDGTEQDKWTKRRFKTFTEALEDSNDGYHFDWDEQKFKGKLIGGLFNVREYEKQDGSTGSATNLAQVTSVKNIRDGKYKIPADKLLHKAQAVTGNDGFMSIPDGVKEELPFD
ncbi:MAG: hypothetical protein IJP92_02680 [Lachnospiraceae bacterium]|nr:hypothetical protein [Lachnospiraceae bacterium]